MKLNLQGLVIFVLMLGLVVTSTFSMAVSSGHLRIRRSRMFRSNPCEYACWRGAYKCDLRYTMVFVYILLLGSVAFVSAKPSPECGAHIKGDEGSITVPMDGTMDGIGGNTKSSCSWIFDIDTDQQPNPDIDLTPKSIIFTILEGHCPTKESGHSLMMVTGKLGQNAEEVCNMINKPIGLGTDAYKTLTLFSKSAVNGDRFKLHYRFVFDCSPACSEGGRCILNKDRNATWCACDPCHHGKTCSESICKNNGICQFGICKCQTGYKGGTCDQIDACASTPCANNATCDTLESGQPLCTCTNQHTGKYCKTKIEQNIVNACTSNPCHNGGKCSVTEDGYRCACVGIYEGIKNCDDVNHCKSNVCKHGGLCEKTETEPGFRCTCPSRFMGETCSDDNDGTYCSAGDDTYDGSNIFWKETKMGNVDNKACPQANGVATRACVANSTADGDLAIWSQPDLSGCVSPLFSHIQAQATHLAQSSTVQTHELLNITTALTNAITNNTDGRLYAGDLAASVDTLKTAADIVRKLDTDTHGLNGVAQGYGGTVSAILDKPRATVWRFTHQGYLENKVTSVLRSSETLSTNLAEHATRLIQRGNKRSVNGPGHLSQTISSSTQNLDLMVHILDRSTDFTAFNAMQSATGVNVTSAVSVPQMVFTKALQATSDAFIHLYSARFTSISGLLSATNALIRQSTNYNFTPVVNSDVVSAKVLNVAEKEFQSLDRAITLTFRLKDTSLSKDLKQNCVFLNMHANSSTDRWSNRGCIRSESLSQGDTTVCYCTHLTNFAVLMDVYDIEDEIDETDSTILTYLTVAGGSLSIIGCLVSIVTFEFFRLNNQRVRIHEQLALTIILVQLFFLFGIDRTENKSVCKAMAICLHYSLVAMFSWMLVEGIQLYLVLVRVFKSQSYMKQYVAFGWGIPLIVVGISVGIFHEQYGTGNLCWLTREVLLVTFVPAVGLVILINTVVLLVVMKIMLTSRSKGSKASAEDKSSIRVGLKAAAVLLPLLGLTWMFGFLSITNKETLIFTYLFTLFNSLQGVFFFVFHCILSVDVQNAYERRSRRRSQHKLTESSLSKRERKMSEYDSSGYSSHYSKASIKTTSTEALSTLDRQKANRFRSHIEPRPQSVTFDDDVFFPATTSQMGSISSQVSGGGLPRVNVNNIVHGNNPTGYHGAVMLNNIGNRASRHGSESSNGYILYYGKEDRNPRENEMYTSFDKNYLYATVNK